jgi:hypothetical protein
MSSSQTYPVTTGPSKPQTERFFFESTGSGVIIKVVEYAHIQAVEGRDIFNLGFGDYDPITDQFIDDVSSNNGDVYKVFATVLSTVEGFYKLHPTAILFVQGSDSQANYAVTCRMSCTRGCGVQCHKMDRRIATYRSFINKNLETLAPDYAFYGRTSSDEPFEDFVKGREYKSLLIYKRS